MKFYVSKCHDRLNGSSYSPEKYCKHICVNPYYKVTIQNEKTKFIIDSGAFQDVGSRTRLNFEEALNRQLKFEKTLTKDGRASEAIVSYDRLVDEQIGDSGQFKARVSEEESKLYVEETIEAAKYLVSKRKELKPRKLILSCQGTSVKQYLDCLTQILEIASSKDIIGFGGFCIISRNKKYEKEFYDVISKGFPMIREKKITRVHIFGVGMFRSLIQADICARLNNLKCSYDTSSSEINSVYGKFFDPINLTLTSVYQKEHKKNGYIPAELAEFNLQSILQIWKRFNRLSLPESFVPGLIPSRKRIEDTNSLKKKNKKIDKVRQSRITDPPLKHGHTFDEQNSFIQ